MEAYPQCYLGDDKSHLYQFKPCKGCGAVGWIQKRRQYCSMACRRGEHSPVWKGDKAGYVAMHERVYRRRGKAFGCQRCDPHCYDKNVRYEWANLTGHYENVNDYESMCKDCHDRYDGRL